MERHLDLRRRLPKERYLTTPMANRLGRLPMEKHLTLRRMVPMERYMTSLIAHRLGRMPMERQRNLNWYTKEGCLEQLEGEGWLLMQMVMQWGAPLPLPYCLQPHILQHLQQ